MFHHHAPHPYTLLLWRTPSFRSSARTYIFVIQFILWPKSNSTSNSFSSRTVSFLTGASVWHCIAVCRRLAIVQCSALADTYVVISVLEMIFGHACRRVWCVRYNNICVWVSPAWDLEGFAWVRCQYGWHCFAWILFISWCASHSCE